MKDPAIMTFQRALDATGTPGPVLGRALVGQRALKGQGANRNAVGANQCNQSQPYIASSPKKTNASSNNSSRLSVQREFGFIEKLLVREC